MNRYDNPYENPALAISAYANLFVAATPGGIQRQEADAQARLAASQDRLPLEVIHTDATLAQVCEKLGIVLGEPTDKLFARVILPDGWKIEPSSHSMWSYLHDAQGRKRASIFYKGAFYDESAHLSVDVRYYVRRFYDDETTTVAVVDSATDQPVFTAGTCKRRAWAEQDALEEQAKVWLVSYYPHHDDVFAYWD